MSALTGAGRSAVPITSASTMGGGVVPSNAFPSYTGVAPGGMIYAAPPGGMMYPAAPPGMVYAAPPPGTVMYANNPAAVRPVYGAPAPNQGRPF